VQDRRKPALVGALGHIAPAVRSGVIDHRLTHAGLRHAPGPADDSRAVARDVLLRPHYLTVAYAGEAGNRLTPATVYVMDSLP
jgi:hypothetical protein